MTTTCQICGRAIKAAKGRIAHHGYQRPQGWYTQTASCFGARHVPFEVGHDAIDKLIPRLRQRIADTQDYLAELRANPPATLDYQPLNGWNKPVGKPVTRERPEGFDPENFRPDNVRGSYVSLFARKFGDGERAIHQMTQDIAYLNARRAEWKAAI